MVGVSVVMGAKGADVKIERLSSSEHRHAHTHTHADARTYTRARTQTYAHYTRAPIARKKERGGVG